MLNQEIDDEEGGGQQRNSEPQTFATMQQQGMARPAPPGYSQGMQPTYQPLPVAGDAPPPPQWLQPLIPQPVLGSAPPPPVYQTPVMTNQTGGAPPPPPLNRQPSVNDPTGSSSIGGNRAQIYNEGGDSGRATASQGGEQSQPYQDYTSFQPEQPVSKYEPDSGSSLPQQEGGTNMPVARRPQIPQQARDVGTASQGLAPVGSNGLPTAIRPYSDPMGGGANPMYKPPGGSTPAGGVGEQLMGALGASHANNVADPTIADEMKKRLTNFQPFQSQQPDADVLNKAKGAYMNGANSYQNPLQGQQQDLVSKMLTNPSAYDTPLFQQNYNMLKGQLDEDYGLQKKQIDETGARRGLYDSTGIVGQLGDAQIQHDRSMSNMATNLLTDRAHTMSADQANASSAANAFNQQGLNQFQANQGAQSQSLSDYINAIMSGNASGLGAFQANEAAQSNRLGQAANYDNDIAQRSMQTSQMNNQQDQQMIQLYLQMMGY